MYARVTTFREPVDDAIRVTREEVVPVVLGLPGSRGGFFLVNRDAAKTLSLTLWESQDALNASRAYREAAGGAHSRRPRIRAAGAGGIRGRSRASMGSRAFQLASATHLGRLLEQARLLLVQRFLNSKPA